MDKIRTIGENITNHIVEPYEDRRAIFQKNGKYYKEINGEEIAKENVGDRMVISFDLP